MSTAKYRIREGRVSCPRGNMARAFIAEKLITLFGVPLFYWPCANAEWRLWKSNAMADIRDDVTLSAPIPAPTMVDIVDVDAERQAAADETFADLPGEVIIPLEKIEAFSRKYPSVQPSPVSEAQLPDDVHITEQDYDMFARVYAAEQRLPYPLRLEIGKALDRLVCSDSTPEQVDTFIKVFAECGLSIAFTYEQQQLRAGPQAAALERALDFIESLTDQHFMMGMDTDEATIDDIRDHARIELASIRKLLAAAEQPKEHTS